MGHVTRKENFSPTGCGYNGSVLALVIYLPRDKIASNMISSLLAVSLNCMAVHLPNPPLASLALDDFFKSDFNPRGGNVVLLQDQPNRISGTAMNIPDGVVDVWLDNKLIAGDVKLQQQNASAPATWETMLPAMPAGYNHTVMITATPSVGQPLLNVTVGINFGVVILCSGQSNMALMVGPGHFDADNATAEALASSRYTGRISLVTNYYPHWQTVNKDTLPRFSAVCWFVMPVLWGFLGLENKMLNVIFFCTSLYARPSCAVCIILHPMRNIRYSGRDLFDSMGGTVPVGLMLGCVSGTPIEYWVRDKTDVATCGNITGRCWNATESENTGLSNLYRTHIQPFVAAGLGISAIVWDQAEADVNCHDHPSQQQSRLGGDPTYACLERAMISGWRQAFTRTPSPGQSTPTPIPWVGVQLPGYQSGRFAFANSVFSMRLAQANGIAKVSSAAVVPTYDLSCPECPWGSIHPTDKQDVGARIALYLRHFVRKDPRVTVLAGPEVSSISAAPGPDNTSVVSVQFTGDATPFAMRPTRNCTDCCAVGGSDFGVSLDGGERWVMGNAPGHIVGASVQFSVNLTLNATSKALVRYTAARGFPQCAVVNARGLPAAPFQTEVHALHQ